MSDPADLADEHYTPLLESSIHDAQEAAAMIPVGAPGTCGECGEPSARIVDGLCARCRDRLAGYYRRIGRSG